MNRRAYPTYADEFAIEQAARRAQAAEMLRLLSVAARKVKAGVARAAALLRERAQDEAPSARSGPVKPARPAFPATDIEAFAASLPADIRTRYASELAAAARIEPWVNAGLAAADFIARGLAQAFHGAARGLHAAARSLDIVAKRLTPTH